MIKKESEKELNSINNDIFPEPGALSVSKDLSMKAKEQVRVAVAPIEELLRHSHALVEKTKSSSWVKKIRGV